jgi:hypothetical protein
MTPITNCPIQFRVECPKLWEKLHTTSDESIRFCETCQKNVHLCLSMEEVHHHATLGNCIAVSQSDVSPPMRMGEVAPWEQYRRGFTQDQEKQAEEPQS